MKFVIRGLKWLLLALYVVVLAGLVRPQLASPEWWYRMVWLVALGLLLLCQAIFVIGASAGDLLQPLRPRRLLAPVIVAGFMMAILVLGLCLSVGVLFGATAQYPLTAGDFYLLVAGGAWVFCSIFFFTRARQWERYKVLRNLTAVVLAASLLEVLATGLSFHIISYSPVPRGKGGYIVSVIVIIVGVCVMLWAIGPAILLLFLRERRRVQGIGNREMGEQGQRG